ncbi:Ldh family oxidoreductase [Halobacterium noricense]|uniref:Ldh family oxidoreductase n=1 Tax=Halobacterium noricense TaxID=223182 RepID=UPI001E465264|nr:Ldh family oxidoreductase [Halobacterium noricense]UHH23914.1 Ldh family oxidoreductase [Halobacterium noricense]
MTSTDVDALEAFATRAIEAYGASKDVAQTVSNSLVSADLVGHSSHGVVRIPYYEAQANDGSLDPTATPTIESAGPFTQVVGGAAFGQITGRYAVEELIETANSHGVGIVGIRDSGHLGRIGEWANRVTEEGLLFMSWVNLQGGAQRIAPPGTADRRLGTNPITFGVPTFDALPFDLLYDGATSQVAHGKIIERDGSGETLPVDWTTTGSGDPVEYAADFEEGIGALLPLGGRETGYKGFDLAVMTELFASIIGDGPVSAKEDQNWQGNGAAFIAIDPEIFTTREELSIRVKALSEYIRSAEPIEDSLEVLLPGEPEYRTSEERRQNGIPIEDAVADGLRNLANELNIEHELPTSLR